MTNCAQWKFFHAYKYKDDSNEMESKLNPRSQLNTNPGGGGVLGLMFAGYVPLASQSTYPIIIYFLANYRPHVSQFVENGLFFFAIPT